MWQEVLILTITTLCVFFAMTRLAKTSRDHALEHPLRDKIRKFITGNDGLRLTELWHGLDLPRATAAYHVQCLEQVGLVQTAKVDGAKRYFGPDTSPTDLTALCVLMRVGARILAMHILQNPGTTQSEVTEVLAMHPKVFRTYAKLLETNGQLEKVREHPYKRYYATERLKTLAPKFRDRFGGGNGAPGPVSPGGST